MDVVSIDSLLSNSEIIRVFPFRNKWTPDDPMAFVGQPPLFRPGTRSTPVRVSVTFTQHKQYAEALASSWSMYYSDVKVGGPAYDDPGGEFTPGRFLKTGCTITSRGCPKKCGWCVVPSRSGAWRPLQIKPGWIVQDDNLLASPAEHLRNVFTMLREQRRGIYFNGGLDKHFFQPWHRDLFDSIKIGELWFACDTLSDLPALEKIVPLLSGISIEKLRCYTMIGYAGESLSDAQRRLERVFEIGFLPFCQLHQPPETQKHYTEEWRILQRKWIRPAAFRSQVAS
jgi:hypothetical protein